MTVKTFIFGACCFGTEAALPPPRPHPSSGLQGACEGSQRAVAHSELRGWALDTRGRNNSAKRLQRSCVLLPLLLYWSRPSGAVASPWVFDACRPRGTKSLCRHTAVPAEPPPKHRAKQRRLCLCHCCHGHSVAEQKELKLFRSVPRVSVGQPPLICPAECAPFLRLCSGCLFVPRRSCWEQPSPLCPPGVLRAWCNIPKSRVAAAVTRVRFLSFLFFRSV